MFGKGGPGAKSLHMERDRRMDQLHFLRVHDAAQGRKRRRRQRFVGRVDRCLDIRAVRRILVRALPPRLERHLLDANK